MFSKKMIKGSAALLIAGTLLLTACGTNTTDESSTNTSNSTVSTTSASGQTATPEEAKLSGEILIDGSSTVYPITEAVAEEFNAINKDVRVPVGVSGTGGGFKQLCAGEIAISNASRHIKSSEEDLCKSNGIELTMLEVAYDGLSVVVSKDNDFVKDLTVDELKAIYSSLSGTVKWSDIRKEWPAEKIVLYSPGADSGTYDYFVEAILGKDDPMKTEGVTFSEDDNVLVTGIAGSKYAIGYFGFAYYEENTDKLNVVAVDGGNGAILPSFESINNGTYSPLSRSLFFYVNNAELTRPEVNAFVKFYIENVGDLAGEVGYVSLPAEKYKEQLALIQ